MQTVSDDIIDKTDFNERSTLARRLVDLLVSIILLLALSPLFLFIALLIKVTSKGPVLFIQERLGKYKKPFDVYKFRTMVPDAEKDTGPTWSKENDPRITRVGRLLRETRLDELPQLLNVFKGDMTLVGCRPIRKHFADKLRKEIPNYDKRFEIKPGITGLAQIESDYANSVIDQKMKFKYEMLYMKNSNFLLDVKILLKTLTIPFRGMGL